MRVIVAVRPGLPVLVAEVFIGRAGRKPILPSWRASRT